MHLSLKGSMDRQPLTDRLGDRLLAEYGGAAAAYSLRALNGNGDSVVRVRRASDNDEKDFTAEQIELGEMVNWVNSQIVPPLDIGVLTPEGRIPVPEGGTSIGIPAAAYSLRNLSTTYTGNVVDVRRSSDDAEESFTAAEVADGTLEAWVSEDTTQYMQFDGVGVNVDTNTQLLPATADFSLAINFFVNANPAATQYFLGSSSFVSNRYNLNIKTGGTVGFFISGIGFADTANTVNLGAVNTLIFSRSGTTVSISLNGGTAATVSTADALDTTANTLIGNAYVSANFEGLITSLTVGATTWNGSQTDAVAKGWTVNGSPTSTLLNDGFVSKWYDQSGNDNHATQGTAASQPKIVDGGSLVSGGLDFDGVDDLLIGTHNVTSAYNFFSVTTDEGSATSYIADTGSGSTNGVNYGRTVNSGGNRQLTLNHGGFAAINATGFLVGTELISQSYDGTTINAFVDGSLVGTSVQGYIASGTVLSLGASGSAGASLNGKMQELIIYPTDQSANRTAIEANIGETYGITGIPAYDNTVDGFVETWYDQSGNGKDATQSVAASQPKIVDAGSLVSGGLDFDGVDDLLELSGSGLDIFKDVGYAQVFAVVKSNETGTGSGRLILATTASSAAARYVLADDGLVSASYRLAGRRLDSNAFQTFTSNSPHGNLEKILTGFLNYNDSEGYLYQNGTNVATELNFQSSGNSSNTSSLLVEFGSNGFDGTIREIIVYNSDQSANRVAIETNINDHYNIY
jgi:hypothetical protein